MNISRNNNNSSKNIYTQRILSILKEKKAATLYRLKELIEELKSDSNGEANLRACLDDLVASKKIFVSTSKKNNGKLVKLFHLNSTINRKDSNASNISEKVSNRNDGNADEHNDRNSNCDFISITCGNNDGGNGKEEPETVTTPQQQISKPTYIALTEIIVSDDFRCREHEDDETIEAYAETFIKYLKANKRADKVRYEELWGIDHLDYPFPPAWIWREGGQVYLIAGFHRYKAAEKAGQNKLLVKEFKGTKENAILLAMRDNRTHGKRLSYGDLKYCVEKALRLFLDKTPGAIARDLGCSRSYASKIGKELSTSGQLTVPETRKGADGRVRSVKRNAKKSTVAPPSKPAKKPTVTPLEEPESKPKSDPPTNKREATSEPLKPIP